MTATLPEPVPLDPPPGDPAALEHLVERVAGTSFLLAVLQADLQGPAGTAPGWHGDDAAAAAAQVGAVIGLAGEVSSVLCTAAGRLSLHRDRLLDVRDRLRVLRAEQDEACAAAWARLAALPDFTTAVRVGTPAAVAVVEEFRAAEARRRREHAALLADLTDDAAATRRVLAECSAVVGGTGRPGDTGRAVAHLALAFPGWGEAELTARGAELAAAFGRMPTPEEREALAREAIALAGLPAFATALLAGMGVDDVETTLFLLGDGALREGSPLATLMASALGAAARSGSAADPVGDVLDAVYVAPDELGSAPDAIALGMGAVLAAGLHSGTGPASSTVVVWGRQLLARERAFAGDFRGHRAVDRALGPSIAPDAADPVQLVAEHLARADAAAAADLLSDTAAWERLLARPWDDGAAAFGALVERAGAEPGPLGDGAVRAGLRALGAGLDDGDPDGWSVDRDTAAVVAPALAQGVAAHVRVAVDALWVGVDGDPAPDALRGLGYLTVDRDAAATVERALTGWAGAQPVPQAGPGEVPDLPAFAVIGSYVAVEEYGQRLAHALDESELEARAELTARRWDWTVGVLAGAGPGAIGMGGSVVEGYAAMALGTDGTWDSPGDDGLVFDRGDAVASGLTALPPEAAGVLGYAAAQAASGFDRAAGVLGVPEAPRSPETHWWGPLVEGITPGWGDLPPFLRRLRKEMVDEGVLPSPVR